MQFILIKGQFLLWRYQIRY